MYPEDNETKALATNGRRHQETKTPATGKKRYQQIMVKDNTKKIIC